MSCRFCKSSDCVKAGFVRGRQRFKCKNCGKHFILDLKPRGFPDLIKKKALHLVKRGKSFRETAKAVGVSFTTVMNWQKAAKAKRNRNKSPEE